VADAILGLHNAMVPLILVAAGLALVAGLTTFFLSRGAPADAGALAGTAATAAKVFRALLVATAALGVLQAIFGLLLLTQGRRPAEGLHFVYGIIVLAAIPVAYVYSDQKQVRRDILILTIAAVAVVGAAFRALATGG
jgi:hypothetical protein